MRGLIRTPQCCIVFPGRAGRGSHQPRADLKHRHRSRSHHLPVSQGRCTCTPEGLLVLLCWSPLVISCGLIAEFGAGPAGAIRRRAAQGAILNEVLFLPPARRSPIRRTQGPRRPSLARTASPLPMSGARSTRCPRGCPNSAPDTFLLIVFDGQAAVEDRVVHAGPADFLDSGVRFPASSEMQMASCSTASLGAPISPGTVNLSRGGSVDDLEPGTSIGRFPGVHISGGHRVDHLPPGAGHARRGQSAARRRGHAAVERGHPRADDHRAELVSNARFHELSSPGLKRRSLYGTAGG